jgi:hypothetical protein
MKFKNRGSVEKLDDTYTEIKRERAGRETNEYIQKMLGGMVTIDINSSSESFETDQFMIYKQLFKWRFCTGDKTSKYKKERKALRTVQNLDLMSHAISSPNRKTSVQAALSIPSSRKQSCSSRLRSWR